MKVLCTADSGGALPEVCLDPSSGITAASHFPITIGREYSVYALTVFTGHAGYYIFDDNELAYPVWRLAPLFEVVDASIPDSWEYGYVRTDVADPGFPLISFPEWASDHAFYERLVDGEATATQTFAKRRLEAEAAV